MPSMVTSIGLRGAMIMGLVLAMNVHEQSLINPSNRSRTIQKASGVTENGSPERGEYMTFSRLAKHWA